jgi:hypothetical protein
MEVRALFGSVDEGLPGDPDLLLKEPTHAAA